MDRIILRAPISIVCAAAIGFLLVYATEMGLACCIAIPTICFLQNCRIHAFLVAFAYYGAASSIVVPAARSFFGTGSSLTFEIAVWGTASFLLACSFAVLWSPHPIAARWRAPLAVLASVPPPLGMIGWASPLTSAGVLFPGTAWLGLIGVLVFAGFSPRHARTWMAALTISAILTNAVFRGIPPLPADWETVDTAFGNVSDENGNIVRLFEASRYIQRRAIQSHANVIIFPETVVAKWTEATDLFWEPTLSALAASGKSILVGAAVNVPGSRRYWNSVLVRGIEKKTFVQRIPVPIGMWRPWSDRGAALHLFGPAIVSVAGERVAPIICYEQFLVWPVLQSLALRPRVLIGMSNLHWAHVTGLRRVQARLFWAWARLFAVPVLAAVNT